MRVRDAAALVLVVATLVAAAGCQRWFFRQYEYEEEIYLKLDGSASVLVNTSVPALIALRGIDLDPSPSARVDRAKVRAFYESPVAQVARVSRPWRRNGRQFVQIRVETNDIRQLARAKPFEWSTYRFGVDNGQYHYLQQWGVAAGKPVPAGTWNGSELVAVRMHLPSKVDYHNATSRQVDRGNIVGWEQSLQDRLRGQPVTMEVRMQMQSILYRTLTIFGLAFAAAVLLMMGIVVWVKRKGARAAA
jgi:hypothetical protein